uniref:YHS domain-containing (seleno)protein n=1 Tax=uncultured Polaribacter sp. TaxID=174711 RepID=UPI00261F289A|nr:YHS domain-containing (seleno)protein [uncultured Polaribacter sp.]
MKYLTLLLFLSQALFSQQIDYNTKKGFIAEGYDVVSYFTKKAPLKGNKKYEATFENAKFRFATQEHLNLFKENPKKYIPQYGGYCAYAVAAKKTKMYIDADAYEIRDGKLYLFYSSWLGSKLKDWQTEDTKKLQEKADKNWQEIKYKKN